MSRKSLILLAALLLLLSPASYASTTSRSLVLRVYSDGYVGVSQTLSVDSKATSVQVPLLATPIYDLVATDQNGSPLSYGPPGGKNITVYTVGATEVNLSYDTDNLTAKEGIVWTLAFTSLYNSTVVLPQDSTLGSVSGTPYSINQTDMYPEMTLASGTWKISYGVPISVTTTSTSQGPSTTGGSGGPFGLSAQEAWEIGGAAGLIVAVALLYWWWRSRRVISSAEGLRQDDVQVLNFIRENGGKVLEPEIRMKFALPKTSAWRQIKRLERLGYVKVTKIGSQNQIEILKEKGEGA